MATDFTGLKADKQQELVIAQTAATRIDLVAEKALLDQAQATLDAAQRAFDKKSARWSAMNEVVSRPGEIQAEIALLP